MQGEAGELVITLEIKRAVTGETEAVELVGTIVEEGETDGGHTLDSGA